jgi:trehalose/maltose transport system substrate-binding protein
MIGRVRTVTRRQFGQILAAGSSAALARRSQRFDVSDWPADLRTDLRGASIAIALPENAVDTAWNDALLGKFRDLTGIEVRAIRPGNDMTTVLAEYLRDLGSGSPAADVYAIDIVWPGMLAEHAEDLQPVFGSLPDILPGLVQNDTFEGRLIAVPYFTEVSLLFYRRDLLERHGVARPPRTWSELERQAGTITVRSRAEGVHPRWGFLWQGAQSEALTCNALEWQISNGAGRLIEADGSLSLIRERMAAALARARAWIGDLSPHEVTVHLEDDSIRMWTRGEAVFMRNWPYAYLEEHAA